MTSQAATRKYYKNIRKKLLHILDEGCPVDIEDKDSPIILFETNLEYAKTRLQGAKICRHQEDIETYTNHVKELQKQWKRENVAEWQERHK